MTAPGTRYRNTTGRTLYGIFPPDAEVTVRDDDLDEMVTLEYDPNDGTHVTNAVALAPGDVAANFEWVADPRPQDTEEDQTAALRRQVADLQQQLNAARGQSGGAVNG